MSSDNKTSSKRKVNDKARKGRNRCSRQGNPNSNTIIAKFKGRTSKLEAHIYDVGVQNQVDIFANTTKEIANYAGRHCKDLRDIRTAIERLQEATIPVPVARNVGTPQSMQ